MKQLLFLAFLISSYWLNAVAQQNVTIKLIVKDCENNEPLPFASIYSKSTKSGSATNFEGAFSFTTSIQDTLFISFIGYESFTLAVKDYINRKQVCLSAKAIQLGVVEISETSTFLYELVTRCRGNRLTKPTNSKTYFLLKTSVNENQTELLEAYYNGTYRNHNVEELELKIGRIFLAPYNDNFFVTLGTSSGINMHKTFEENLFFPVSPLELTKKKMRKEFELAFREKYEQDNSTIYVINFKRKDNTVNGFNGRIWVDSTQSQLIKIVLRNEEGSNSPFLPVGDAKEIDKVDFDITKTFQTVDGIRSIRSIDFNYSMSFIRDDNSRATVDTKAVLFAYQYGEEFLLPKFPKAYFLNDYQSMNLAPYNHFFWNENNEFKLEAEEKDKDLFINSQTTNFIDSFSYDPTTRQISFSQPTYRRWNEKRILLNDFKRGGYNSSSGNFSSVYSKYRLDIKIYMDINQIDDSIDVQLATVFDPFTSYSYLEKGQESLAFINMLFDLAEIQKRALAEEIKNMKDIKLIQKTYDKYVAEFKDIASEYYTSVIGGKKKDEMRRWNEYILQTLGIDNMETFNL